MIAARIEDFGDWAEDQFSGLCSSSGVTRNKSGQDRTGWDFIIEFPSKPISGVPADLLPPETSAIVQVKSKKNGKPSATMKLSNALRFAKNPTPCFLVLFLATNGGQPVRIFAKHFWKIDIESALRRARKADQESRHDLHKIPITYNFTDADDHSNDLLKWIATTIDAQNGRYGEEKLSLIKTVGFEDGFIQGNISFATKDLASLVDNQIGLLPTAPIINITVKQTRFGIEARMPIFSGKPDSVSFQSYPLTCRVRIRPLDGNDIWLDGDLFLPNFSGLPLKFAKLRVVADFIEIIVSGNREAKISLSYDGTKQRGLASQKALINVFRLARLGPLNMQISSEGRPNIPISGYLPISEEIGDFEQLLHIFTCLETVSYGIIPSDLTMSLCEIDDAWNSIVNFNGLVAGTDFQGRFEIVAALPVEVKPPKCIFLYDFVEIGDWVFGVVVRRAVLDFKLNSTKGEFLLGPSRVVEALVRRNNDNTFQSDLHALYQAALELEVVEVIQMFGGSYQAMLTMSGGITS